MLCTDKTFLDKYVSEFRLVVGLVAGILVQVSQNGWIWSQATYPDAQALIYYLSIFNFGIFSVDEIHYDPQELLLERIQALCEMIADLQIDSSFEQLDQRLHFFHGVLLLLYELIRNFRILSRYFVWSIFLYLAVALRVSAQFSL